MSLKENLQADKLLALNLVVDWSAHLPQIQWRGWKLTPPGENPGVLDLGHLSLAEALRSCRAEMDYVGFLRLGTFIRENLNDTEAELLALEKAWSFRWNEEAFLLHDIFTKLPSSFQSWAREKKTAFNDLRPLLRAQPESLEPFLEKFSESAFSKSVGAEILERLCDLTAQELSDAKVLFNQSPQHWLSVLRMQAQPLTSKKDQQRKNAIRSWPWPARVKGEWKRQGDQAGLFVEIYSPAPEDLKAKLKDLEALCEKWREEL